MDDVAPAGRRRDTCGAPSSGGPGRPSRLPAAGAAHLVDGFVRPMPRWRTASSCSTTWPSPRRPAHVDRAPRLAGSAAGGDRGRGSKATGGAALEGAWRAGFPASILPRPSPVLCSPRQHFFDRRLPRMRAGESLGSVRAPGYRPCAAVDDGALGNSSEPQKATGNFMLSILAMFITSGKATNTRSVCCLTGRRPQSGADSSARGASMATTTCIPAAMAISTPSFGKTSCFAGTAMSAVSLQAFS